MPRSVSSRCARWPRNVEEGVSRPSTVISRRHSCGSAGKAINGKHAHMPSKEGHGVRGVPVIVGRRNLERVASQLSNLLLLINGIGRVIAYEHELRSVDEKQTLHPDG
jgi:hypothetical protein